ncbi:VOC family protein [Streptomyces sp. NPDC059785]|uniref:VOC family protein n=1 Tax=Streptomyces sp. NPDC059785 TaxID=3346945 RepID=UPI00366612A0
MVDHAASAAPAPSAEGVPCWVDAQLPDVAAGRRFYGELFGWSYREAYSAPRTPGTPGTERAASVWAYLGGRPVAGLVPKRDGRMPTVWTVYFAATDASALAVRVREAGGQVITQPLPVGSLGTSVLAADPQGAVFGLWEPGRHPGFGRHHEVGTFCRAELFARDPSAGFYEELFGRDAPEAGRNAAETGRGPLAGVFPAEMPPHFLVHFGVRDCDSALGTVLRLGGRVQAPPFDTSYGRVAVVTDNQGASFVLLQR